MLALLEPPESSTRKNGPSEAPRGGRKGRLVRVGLPGQQASRRMLSIFEVHWWYMIRPMGVGGRASRDMVMFSFDVKVWLSIAML